MTGDGRVWNPMSQQYDPAPPTLTEFMLARITEDEDLARPGIRDFGGFGRDAWALFRWGYEIDVNFERILAECEAKRRIVGRAQSAERWATSEDDADYDDHGSQSASAVADAWLQALQLIALPYAGHPDYRGEWRP